MEAKQKAVELVDKLRLKSNNYNLLYYFNPIKLTYENSIIGNAVHLAK